MHSAEISHAVVMTLIAAVFYRKVMLTWLQNCCHSVLTSD